MGLRALGFGLVLLFLVSSFVQGSDEEEVELREATSLLRVSPLQQDLKYFHETNLNPQLNSKKIVFLLGLTSGSIAFLSAQGDWELLKFAISPCAAAGQGFWMDVAEGTYFLATAPTTTVGLYDNLITFKDFILKNKGYMDYRKEYTGALLTAVPGAAIMSGVKYSFLAYLQVPTYVIVASCLRESIRFLRLARQNAWESVYERGTGLGTTAQIRNNRNYIGQLLVEQEQKILQLSDLEIKAALDELLKPYDNQEITIDKIGKLLTLSFAEEEEVALTYPASSVWQDIWRYVEPTITVTAVPTMIGLGSSLIMGLDDSAQSFCNVSNTTVVNASQDSESSTDIVQVPIQVIFPAAGCTILVLPWVWNRTQKVLKRLFNSPVTRHSTIRKAINGGSIVQTGFQVGGSVALKYMHIPELQHLPPPFDWMDNLAYSMWFFGFIERGLNRGNHRAWDMFLQRFKKDDPEARIRLLRSQIRSLRYFIHELKENEFVDLHQKLVERGHLSAERKYY